MKNTYVFLRHAETLKDPSVHPKEWRLTQDGITKIEGYLKRGFFKGITKIVSSGENKAYSTGVPIAENMGLEITQMNEFNEIGRSPVFLPDDQFLKQKKRQLTELDTQVDGGESGRDALQRFKSGIQNLEEQYNGETILVVTHGTVLSLYFAELNNKFETIFNRWRRLPFCAIGVVRDNKVEKDLGEKSLVRHFKIPQK
jgi:broad specificity phosphatase PhoE